MALIVEDKKKVYEKPDSGTFVAVIADVVDLGPKPTKYGSRNKIRLVWFWVSWQRLAAVTRMTQRAILFVSW